jgi:signal transduction histidine kinase
MHPRTPLPKSLPPQELTLPIRSTQKTRLKKRLSQLLPSFFIETRTQILLSFLGVILLFLGASIPLNKIVLELKLQDRVEEEINQRVDIFLQEYTRFNPKNEEDLKAFFSDFLSKTLVEDDEFLIVFLNGSFLKSNPLSLPSILDPSSYLISDWISLQSVKKGMIETTDPRIGKLLFHIEPLLVEANSDPVKSESEDISNNILGVFIIARTTSGEEEEIKSIMSVVSTSISIVFIGSAVLTWIISGYILYPLRYLAKTVRQISESNLSERIPIRGKGELSLLSQTFNEMLDRLELAFRVQQNFINDASHELRTPITIIQGHLDLIGSVDPQQQETLNLVQDELNRMNRFVGDLLLLAQTEQPHFWDPHWEDLGTLTQAIYEKASVIPTCKFELQEKGEGWVRLDTQRVTQAIMNLIVNANQSTPKEGTIKFGSSKDKTHVCFWVSDTGKGIAPEDQERIFQRFARSRHNPRTSDGAGLGLAIVQAIALSGQGRIELFSQPGEGSTFMLIFPTKQRKP